MGLAWRATSTGALFALAVSQARPALAQSATPSEPSAPAAGVPTTPAAAATPSGTVVPLEVTVAGHKHAPAVTSLTRAEVRELPGAFGDPFRAVEALPGVTPIVSGLPYFYVRGAPPGNLGYFLDGVRVPYLFHLLGGPSVVHPAMVERVDLYPGGYPALFGRFSGGIVTAETNEPRTDLNGEASLRLFDAGAMAETGFADGRGTVLLGGRYSYTAALLSIVQPLISLDYRDAQARVTYDLSPRDRLTAFGFGAYDFLRVKEDGSGGSFIGTEFYRLDLRWDHSLGSRGNLRQALTFGYDRSSLLMTGDYTDRSVALRSEVQQHLNERMTWRLGADVASDSFTRRSAGLRDPDAPAPDEQERWLRGLNQQLGSGAWTDLVLRLGERWEVIPGLRADLFARDGDAAIGLDPRLATRFAASERVTFVQTSGLAHQAPALLAPLPGVEINSLEGGLQTSWQNSLGVEVTLPRSVTASVTGYYTRFFGLFDMVQAIREDPSSLGAARTEGQAYGLEVLLRRRLTERIGGFLSYTLARSERDAGGRWVPSQFDRTHVLNAALAFNLGRKWRFGNRLVYYSGLPRYPSFGGAMIIGATSSPPREVDHWRLDVRLEKRWSYEQGRWLAFVFDWLNASLTKESIDGAPVGPVTLPSLGLEAGW
jgi:hypothetical protein